MSNDCSFSTFQTVLLLSTENTVQIVSVLFLVITVVVLRDLKLQQQKNNIKKVFPIVHHIRNVCRNTGITISPWLLGLLVLPVSLVPLCLPGQYQKNWILSVLGADYRSYNTDKADSLTTYHVAFLTCLSFWPYWSTVALPSQEKTGGKNM